MKKIVRFIATFWTLGTLSRYDSRLRKGKVFGRPFCPLRFSARFFTFWFGRYNYNNIILQAKGVSKDDKIKISDRGTFNFTRYLEKKLILKIADILKINFSPVTGYITSGGTESNIYAMWVAREWARKIATQSSKNFWLVPDNSHYSIDKALHLLDIKNDAQSQVINIHSDATGRADHDQIKQLIEDIRSHGNDAIILPLTAMTTECGAIDPIKELSRFIEEKKFDNIFFHIDAAFSGFFLPFTTKYQDIFSQPAISSITVDFSKTAGGPVGSGAVIFRYGLEEFATVPARYLLGGSDRTLSGSRSGLNVIAMYGLFSVNSEKDFKKEVLNSMEKASFLADKLREISFIKMLYEPELNYIVFELYNLNEAKKQKVINILESYSISPSVTELDGKQQEIFKIITRSDHAYRNINKLAKELKTV